ncbi:MAG: hypothetical protein ROO73_05105 [Roseivirga sp.]
MNSKRVVSLLALWTLGCQEAPPPAPASLTSPPTTTKACPLPSEEPTKDPIAVLEATIQTHFGRSLNQTDPKTLLTPLQEAITKASLEEVELLLSHPQIEPSNYYKYCERVQHINEDYCTPPLLLACLKLAGQQVDFEQGLAVVEALLEAGLDPNQKYERLILAVDYLQQKGIEAFNATQKREGGRYVVEDMYFGEACVEQMQDPAQKQRLLALLEL